MSGFQDKEEDELTSWLWAGLWLLAIYVSIPLARDIQEFVRSHLTSHVFSWITVGMVFAAGAMILQRVRSARLKMRGSQVVILLMIGIIFCLLVWNLRANPEEAFHFVQYGVLSYLLFRALRHRFSSRSIYLVALALGTGAGAVDELIQWVVPRRFFDFRDILINATAVFLVQVAILAGIRPVTVRAVFDRAGLRVFCGLGMIISLLFVYMTANTPRIWDLYKRDVPMWGKIDEVLVEYGYRIEDPEIGVFNSRLHPAELASQDATNGAQVARILDRHPGTDDRFFALVLRRPAYRFPFLIEARMHLYTRDRFVLDARLPSASPDQIRVAASGADRENRIMEQYFPVTFSNAHYKWDAETEAFVRAHADRNHPFKSPVARHLTTRISGPVAISIPAAVFFAFLIAQIMMARSSRIT